MSASRRLIQKQVARDQSDQVQVAGDLNIYNAIAATPSTSARLRIGSPPPLASAFQDRSDFTSLAESAGTIVLRQVMSGDGGTGKTQIAVRAFEESAADLRVWVRAESQSSILGAYAEVASRLGLGGSDIDQSSLAVRFLDFLAVTTDTWLVVLDDLDDPATLDSLWPPDGGRVIVTTRRRDASLTGGGRSIIDVGVFSPAEAYGYLNDRLTPHLDQLPANALDEAELLASDMGFLPLALSHSAAVILDAAITCADYRVMFNDRETSLKDLFPPRADGDGYSKVVAASWSLAMEAANRIAPTGLVTPLAVLIAVLDPNGVPESALLSPHALDFLTTRLATGQATTDMAREAIRALNRMSIISQEIQPPHRLVRMHGLTGRAVLESNFEEPIESAIELASEVLLSIWPRIERDREFGDLLRSNARWITENHGNHLWGLSEGAPVLLFRAARSLGEIGLVRQSISAYFDLVEVAVARVGSEHPDTLAARNNLAGAYESAGDLGRAIPLYEANLEDSQRVLGLEHQATFTARNNLAGAYESAGDLGRAVPLYEANLEDRERVLGLEHPDTLTARNNLAYAYQSAGDLGRAIPLYEVNLQDRGRVLGLEHPDTFASRNNLAGAYHSAGDLGRAIPLYEANLEDSERVLGIEHPATFTAHNNLASAYDSAGDLGRAIPLYEANLERRERVLGSEHPDTFAARNNLAGAYESVGDLGRAIPLYEANFDDCKRVLGSKHPTTLTSQNNLAYAYQSAGDLGRAIPLYEANLEDRERVLGLDHPYTFTARNNLAAAYQSGGNVDRAIPLFEANLKDRERVLGLEHPDTLSARNNLAGAYESAGDLGRAILLYEANLDDHERVLGLEHPATLKARSNLASAYLTAGDLNRAIPLYETNLRDRQRVLGPQHPDSLTARNQLASTYVLAGDLGRAIPLFEANVEDCERVLGLEHPATLIARKNLSGARRGVSKGLRGWWARRWASSQSSRQADPPLC